MSDIRVNVPPRALYVEEITAVWSEQVEAVLRTGRLLIAAKEALAHGEFLAMIEDDLPFGRQTAFRLMKIAENPVLSNVAHAQHLPTSWMTLYEITKLADAEIEARISDGRINPETTRVEIPSSAKAPKPEKVKKVERPVTLDAWLRLKPPARAKLLTGTGSDGFNRQTDANIEWAGWSWNPVTGCNHECPYCYARDLAAKWYPEDVGFKPALWPTRLRAPVKRQPDGDGADKNIFVCSMADLFGRWVPAEWIEAVLQTVRDSPQWNFLFLTKFPKRMSEFEIPENAWMGTTVDVQARVTNAEKAMAKVKSGVRWLSLEPVLEPLKFSHLDLFQWVVIGGSSPSRATYDSPATPEWNVPVDWLVDIHRQVRAANCAVYYKTNSGLDGITRLREYPGVERVVPRAPEVFDYLKKIPAKERIG